MARNVQYKFGLLNNKDDSASLGNFADKKTQLITTMVEAENVNVFGKLNASRRAGYEQVNAAGSHSAFSTKDEKYCYLVSSANLCRLQDDMTITPLAPLSNEDRMWMVDINKLVLASNGTDQLLIKQGEIIPLPVPSEQHEIQFPAARYLCLYNGVIYGATANGLVMSKAYNLLADERALTIPLPNITMVAPVKDGLWVGTEEKVYWIGGRGDDEFVLQERGDSGVVRGAFASFNSGQVTDEDSKEPAVIMATGDGICIGRNGGVLDNVSSASVATGSGSSGCCHVVEKMGGTFFIVHIAGLSEINTFTGAEYITNERNY